MKAIRLVAMMAALLSCASALAGFKDEMRQPWQRNDTAFIRAWKVVGAFKCDLARDCLDIPGGEAAAKPGADQKRADGKALEWMDHRAWGDRVGFDAAQGERDGAVAYAFADVERPAAGKARLSIGSSDGVRVWVNGRLVLSRDGHRSLTPDEDVVDVDLVKGANALLLKASATGSFTVRVLEPGATLARVVEIGPSLIEIQPELFTVRTDVDGSRAAAEPVKVEVVKPGGDVAFSASAARGALVVVDAKGWPDGPYEVRASTLTATRRTVVTHLPWFKGDALAMARALAADAGKADAATPAGFTLKMLARMVDDRLGVALADAHGNPWPKIHSPLMEYAELVLERQGRADARVHSDGFVRLAWRDPVDGSPQYARAYLPHGYDPAKPWPLVLMLHGFNPPNPEYVRWWGADNRHVDLGADVVYIEPHGRGNTQYVGMGDADVMRVIAEAKKSFHIDADRIYLSGESMGGWGTWNVAMRHPDVFAAIAPIFGGADYHLQMSEEQLASLPPAERFLNERRSSWAQADGLNNMPIFVHQGDADQSVNVEWSRWGVRLLQRWGYDVRYHEYPGRGHETLQASNPAMNLEWFLEHGRNPDPRHVRLRSAELRHAKSYWVDVRQMASPLDFMNVDAEIIDRNVIRLDTHNVLEVVLEPSAALIDPAQPVKVVWNGVAHDLHLDAGGLRLVDPGYKPGKLVKSAALPGGINDFIVTPFAVVIGTTAKDPGMRAAVRDKAQRYIDGWRDWQKVEPRVFEDTKITDADIAQYSLLLFGGADANRVTAALAKSLPLKVTADSISIGDHRYAARDAAVHLLYPNPRNSARYVWVVAANSAGGMSGAQTGQFFQPEWDYIIDDSRVPGAGQQVWRSQVSVVSGMFDHDWRFSSALAVPGDDGARAKSRKIEWRRDAVHVDGAKLDAYAGHYQLQNGPVVEFRRVGSKLIAYTGPQADELIAQDDANFYVPRFDAWLTFERDASGKVTGITVAQGGEYSARKLD